MIIVLQIQQQKIVARFNKNLFFIESNHQEILLDMIKISLYYTCAHTPCRDNTL